MQKVSKRGPASGSLPTGDLLAGVAGARGGLPGWGHRTRPAGSGVQPLPLPNLCRVRRAGHTGPQAGDKGICCHLPTRRSR